jgi:hypothetical protein
MPLNNNANLRLVQVDTIILTLFIPAPLENSRFRKLEGIIFKAHFLLMVIPLKQM